MFTSVPIIWFTTWDKEYKSEVLLRRPRLYRIGLENTYFNKWVFWRWFFYATWQGILMVMITYLTMTSLSPDRLGREGSMESAGAFIFTAIVIVVNIKLLISSFEITIWIIFLIFLSILVYFVTLWFFTWYSAEADDYGVFMQLFVCPTTYVCLTFFMSSYILVDTGMRYAKIEINNLLSRRKERAEYEAWLADQELKKTAVQDHITGKEKVKGK